MVATDDALATKAGAAVLEAGGNAVDAAVAAAFVLAVAFPTAGNIGGGGFLVARVGHSSFALDFREMAPAASTPTMYLGADGKPTRDSRSGWRSVGVPGTVLGLWEAWHKLGSKKKSWPDLLAPAIDLADRGFVVNAPFARTIALAQTQLATSPASAALFLPGGSPPEPGTTWRDPELATVLRRIAAAGPAGFYEGPVADAIARAMKENGGLVTAADLRGYRAKWRAPIEYEYRGKRIIGMPPPSSGGVTTAMVAHLLSGWDLHGFGWHSVEHVHLAAEAMRRAFMARNAKLGDPDFVRNPVSELLSDTWAREQRATIELDRATPTTTLSPGIVPGASGGPHTTHMSFTDGDGNAVALTTTLNAWFGSAITVPGLGFVLNDEMDDFASAPGSANMFGLVQGEPNAIAPRKRMLSSMSPTIVLGDNDQPDLVLGAAGGSRIITTVFEEMSNVLDFGMDVADAVTAPRFHQQDLPDVLLLEPHALPDAVRAALERMGHPTQEAAHIADAPAIGRIGGLWEGAAEPRRDGSLALGL
jgi:gamma-glutamyltranspeptidase/glutathione hydrolase